MSGILPWLAFGDPTLGGRQAPGEEIDPGMEAFSPISSLIPDQDAAPADGAPIFDDRALAQDTANDGQPLYNGTPAFETDSDNGPAGERREEYKNLGWHKNGFMNRHDSNPMWYFKYYLNYDPLRCACNELSTNGWYMEPARDAQMWPSVTWGQVCFYREYSCCGCERFTNECVWHAYVKPGMAPDDSNDSWTWDDWNTWVDACCNVDNFGKFKWKNRPLGWACNSSNMCCEGTCKNGTCQK